MPNSRLFSCHRGVVVFDVSGVEDEGVRFFFHHFVVGGKAFHRLEGFLGGGGGGNHHVIDWLFGFDDECAVIARVAETRCQ